jgi:hypothetical protein
MSRKPQLVCQHPPSTRPTRQDEKATGKALLLALILAAVGTWLLFKFVLGNFPFAIFIGELTWWKGAILFVILFFILVGMLTHQNDVDKAKRDYDESLRKLKQSPNNPDLRQQSLQLGRQYSDLARDSHGRTIFDEVALMNDINAACAGATVGLSAVGRVEVTNTTGVGSTSVAAEIDKLGQLFIKGVITADEFERGKALFLGAPPDKAASAIELLRNLDALRDQGILSQSEFNVKKWEILSERLFSGNMQPAGRP